MMNLTRRLFGTLSAGSVVAVSAAKADIAPAPHNHIRLSDGSVHPVSPEWYERNVRIAGVTRENETRRLAILELSNERALTKRERRELEALTQFKNANKAHRLFGDFYQGKYPALDHVHGMSCRKACGCEVHLMFDHYGSLPMHAYETRAACADHVHPNASDHWATLLAAEKVA